mmetsp:Transcript_27109/g.65448  ORF Transcript_27109/g.65448 Transcript_27109/m.65448 type:complete len:209 (+) Transcript_27109:1888-2514(+)
MASWKSVVHEAVLLTSFSEISAPSPSMAAKSCKYCAQLMMSSSIAGPGKKCESFHRFFLRAAGGATCAWCVSAACTRSKSPCCCAASRDAPSCLPRVALCSRAHSSLHTDLYHRMAGFAGAHSASFGLRPYFSWKARWKRARRASRSSFMLRRSAALVFERSCAPPSRWAAACLHIPTAADGNDGTEGGRRGAVRGRRFGGGSSGCGG